MRALMHFIDEMPATAVRFSDVQSRVFLPKLSENEAAKLFVAMAEVKSRCAANLC